MLRWLCLSWVLGFTACSGPAAHLRADPPRLLSVRTGGWRPEVRERLDALLTEHGRSSPSYNPRRRPVAVFDLDNTLIKNDVGDVLMAWMVEHDELHAPPGGDWRWTSSHLTDAALQSLSGACVDAASPEGRLLTRLHERCASAVLGIYLEGKTPEGASAWRQGTTATLHASYAWAAQLLAGHTPSRLRELASEALAVALVEPIGAKRRIAGYELASSIRVYDAQRDLIEAMQANGFEVWVVSASPQPAVEVVAARLGIPAHQVIGIRNVYVEGRAQPVFEGCGPVPDGKDTLMTYDEGKRCWVNKRIFGLPVEAQLRRAEDPASRPLFAAGDSDTDVSMLQDAVGLKLVIRRNKRRIMCNALANRNGTWLLQPMFLAPVAPMGPVPCGSHADGPVLDEEGRPIPDQQDAGP
ncbi:lipoprotein LppF [Myxococcus stipitatus DSM 14675]|uniref:Lipoprotein LppF n=1 Tax=Myxococcus stipitatus (strain DSM 14675 / JCM 12634 / Mx s8) TaxID=1278073 RepID=L7U5N1_MYXSD|nr:HAD family hydrolase [Myxococcus stipitatus]AGC43155.1 lipoprotein LppF [Myxococcus stipitatus DSM 14675]